MFIVFMTNRKDYEPFSAANSMAAGHGGWGCGVLVAGCVSEMTAEDSG